MTWTDVHANDLFCPHDENERDQWVMASAQAIMMEAGVQPEPDVARYVTEHGDLPEEGCSKW